MTRIPKQWLYALPVLFILAATLSPARGGEPEAISFCIACGRRGVADGVLNAMLFFPLGFVPFGNSRSLGRRVLAGFLLSMFVELCQTFVPGRDPSLSDVMFNTIGTTLGAYASRLGRRWVDPDSRDTRILTAAGVALALIVAAGTILSLSPLNFSEWSTHHVETRITRPDSAQNFEFLAQIPVLHDDELVAVVRWGGALGISSPTWAGAHGLDEPVYWSYGALEKYKPPVRVSLAMARRSWRVALNGSEGHPVGPSVGLGWTLLLYPDAVAPRWILLLDAIWLFALCFPIGYSSGRRYFVRACSALVVGFFLIPLATGAPSASLAEWIGVASGLLFGQSIGRLRVPWRSDHRPESSDSEGT